MTKRKTKPPPGAPWWWPGEQLRLFDPEPHQAALFPEDPDAEPDAEPEPEPVARRRRRQRVA